jgi:hypothetical protein
MSIQEDIVQDGGTIKATEPIIEPDKSKKKKIKDIETSKKVLGAVLALSFLGLFSSVIAMFLRIEGSVEMAKAFRDIVLVELGFYTWKAKSENIMKYGDKHPGKDKPLDSAQSTSGFFGGSNYNDTNMY